MLISYQYNYANFKLDREEAISEWLQKIALEENKKIEKLLYIFCDDEEILKINRDFLNHDYFTDIITFDNSFLGHISGELYISIDTINSNAINFGINFSEELYRVIVHGLLHLLGYYDKTEEEGRIMREKENHYLSYLE